MLFSGSTKLLAIRGKLKHNQGNASITVGEFWQNSQSSFRLQFQPAMWFSRGTSDFTPIVRLKQPRCNREGVIEYLCMRCILCAAAREWIILAGSDAHAHSDRGRLRVWLAPALSTLWQRPALPPRSVPDFPYCFATRDLPKHPTLTNHDIFLAEPSQTSPLAALIRIYNFSP